MFTTKYRKHKYTKFHCRNQVRLRETEPEAELHRVAPHLNSLSPNRWKNTYLLYMSLRKVEHALSFSRYRHQRTRARVPKLPVKRCLRVWNQKTRYRHAKHYPRHELMVSAEKTTLPLADDEEEPFWGSPPAFLTSLPLLKPPELFSPFPFTKFPLIDTSDDAIFFPLKLLTDLSHTTWQDRSLRFSSPLQNPNTKSSNRATKLTHTKQHQFPKPLSLSLYTFRGLFQPISLFLCFSLYLLLSFFLYFILYFICSLSVDKWLALQHQNQCRRGRLNQSGQNSVQSIKPRSIPNHSGQPAFTGWAPLETGYTRW